MGHDTRQAKDLSATASNFTKLQGNCASPTTCIILFLNTLFLLPSHIFHAFIRRLNTYRAYMNIKCSTANKFPHGQ